MRKSIVLLSMLALTTHCGAESYGTESYDWHQEAGLQKIRKKPTSASEKAADTQRKRDANAALASDEWAQSAGITSYPTARSIKSDFSKLTKSGRNVHHKLNAVVMGINKKNYHEGDLDDIYKAASDAAIATRTGTTARRLDKSERNDVLQFFHESLRLTLSHPTKKKIHLITQRKKPGKRVKHRAVKMGGQNSYTYVKPDGTGDYTALIPKNGDSIVTIRKYEIE